MILHVACHPTNARQLTAALSENKTLKRQLSEHQAFAAEAEQRAVKATHQCTRLQQELAEARAEADAVPSPPPRRPTFDSPLAQSIDGRDLEVFELQEQVAALQRALMASSLHEGCSSPPPITVCASLSTPTLRRGTLDVLSADVQALQARLADTEAELVACRGQRDALRAELDFHKGTFLWSC